MSHLPEDRPEDRIGDIVDRYRIERLLGTGGFGAVYAAQHIHMKRSVALKLLHSQQLRGPKGLEMRNRFLREAQAAAAVGHAGIVEVYDSGIAGEDTFVAMELLEGEDLQSYLEREQTVAAPAAVAFIQRLLEPVGAAHRAGIVHRDLKPANIFLVKKETGGPLEAQTLKLLDFGISKVRGDGVEKLTGTGMVMGTPHYMAPEMFLGVSDVDQRADLYAVGAILYQMLTARTPHNATSYEQLIVRVATQPAPSLGVHRPDLPLGLVEVVDRALRTDAAERYASAEAFADALALADKGPPSMTEEDMLGETAHSLPPAALATRPADSASRTPTQAEPQSRYRWLALAAGMILLGSLAAWTLMSGPAELATLPVPVTEPAVIPPALDQSSSRVEPSALTPVAPPETTPSAMLAPPSMTSPMRDVRPRMIASPMIAAPPNMSAPPVNPPPVNTPPVNTAEPPESAPQGEERPGRIQTSCGPMYLAGPQSRIHISSIRQRRVIETGALRETILAQGGRRILRCFGREPFPIGQLVNFHVGPGHTLSNVSLRIRCPIAPRVQSCLIGVFESIDLSGVEHNEGDVQIGFSAG